MAFNVVLFTDCCIPACVKGFISSASSRSLSFSAAAKEIPDFEERETSYHCPALFKEFTFKGDHSALPMRRRALPRSSITRVSWKTYQKAGSKSGSNSIRSIAYPYHSIVITEAFKPPGIPHFVKRKEGSSSALSPFQEFNCLCSITVSIYNNCLHPVPCSNLKGSRIPAVNFSQLGNGPVILKSSFCREAPITISTALEYPPPCSEARTLASAIAYSCWSP